jgi:VWFA-related protein
MLFPKIGIRQAAWVVAIGISVFVFAQESPTFKVDVKVVNVLATVRDRSGHFVSDLSKDDFILEENGKPQEITYFSRQTDLPLTIGLLIDTSGSQRNLIQDERIASYQFLRQVLRPDRDRAFIIKFGRAAELLQDLTHSPDLLQKALTALTNPPMLRRSANPPGPSTLRADSLVQIWPQGRQMPGGQRRQGGGRQGGGQGVFQGGGTVLFDAVYLASNEILQKQEGRKAIICISDGVDVGSTISEKVATAAAHYADTLIYCIRYYDSTAYGSTGGLASLINNQGSEGKATLTALSKETGGRMFEVSNKLLLQEIYDRIQQELRNQYSLGYEPSKAGGAGFRSIKLRTKKGKLEVVTRAGYYAR